MSTPTAADDDASRKDPRSDHPVHSDSRRVAIILAYWAVVLVGLPVWWWMTSIQRLPLPAGRIERLHERTLKFPVRLVVNVGDAGYDAAAFCDALQQQLSRLEHENVQEWIPLGVELSCHSHTSDSDAVTSQEDTYHVRVRKGTGATSFQLEGRTLMVTGRPEDPSLPKDIIEVVRDLLLPYSQDSLHSVSTESRVAQYAERYTLAFTLLNEDASVGGAATGWDIESAVNDYIIATVNQMAGMHKFAIESQVQWFGSLAPELVTSLHGADGSNTWLISPDKLPVFINSAEWTLSSGVSNDPVLHFILFVPSVERRPLHVDAGVNSAQSDAFIVPQWGGVVIYNPLQSDDVTRNMHLDMQDLSEPFSLFRAQLRALLGVPELPARLTGPSDVHISPWQLEALRRRRALENARNSVDTLQSIVSLVRQIDNMPVGPDVVGQVNGALDAIDQANESMNTSLSRTLYHTIEAFVLSSKAFFNPGMIGLLYYPTEHKYAVYTPLFAPVTVPLVVAVIREVKAWRGRKGVGAVRAKAE